MTDPYRNRLESARVARIEGRLVDALLQLKRAVGLSRRSDRPRDLIRALKALGQIERDLGYNDAAGPLYEEAVELCRKEVDALALAHTIRHLGDIHQDSGKLELARQCYEEALQIYRSQERTAPLDLANALRPFALLEEKVGRREDAVRLWTEARSLYAETGILEGVAECTAHLEKLQGIPEG